MKQKTVYQTDDDDLFVYDLVVYELALAPGHYSIPYRAYEDVPPDAPPGKVARRVAGKWLLVDDHRGAELWLAETGKPYQVKQEIELEGETTVSYPGWGPLPAWLTLEKPVPEPTFDELRKVEQAAATAMRWRVMTGGITLPSGVRVGTTIDDQNRITSVVANASLAGLSDDDEVDFKSESGWVRVTVAQVKQIAGAVGLFVQACYSAERAHHDAIEALGDDRAALDAYDVSIGWPH